MSAIPVAAIQLGVVVRARPVGPGQTTGSHDQQVRLVRALLAGSAGREIEAAGCDASRVFERADEGLDAAITLDSQLRRLPIELMGVDVGIGLDRIASDMTPSDAIARIAASAPAGGFGLGHDLARIIAADPPDRLVVTSTGGELPGRADDVDVLVPASGAVPNNLGASPTSFVGREPEIREIRRVMEDERVITITGVPGSGKSRLAREIAERVLGRYMDGCWFVGLAPVSDPRLVASAIADAIGIPVPPGRSTTDAVSAHVRDRRMLIVLDDLDHLVAAAPDIEAAFGAAPGVRIIITSRMPLHVTGEHGFALAPLDVAGAGWRLTDASPAAIDLFVQRAMTAHPGFRIADDETEALIELCRRLDGLPLAIELAAARVKTLSIRSILERLDERLGLLAGGPSDERSHHESLAAAIAWSYDLLGPSAQRLFRRLSVFRGGWSLDGALSQAGLEPRIDDNPLDVLASLQDNKLILRLDAGDAAPRFTMLESLRSYAADRLDASEDRDAAVQRHAADLVEFVDRIGSQLTGPGQAAALDRLAVEHDNVRAALPVLIRSSPADALRLVAGIWRFWQMRGHLVEGSRWADDALEAADDDVPATVLARALAAAGGLAYWRGDLAETERCYERVVAIRRTLDVDVDIAEALFDLAFVFDPALRPPPEDRDRTARGIRLAEEAHERFLRAGHEHGIARSEWFLGSIMANRDLARAEGLLESSVQRFRRLGDPFGLGWALHSYGLTLLRSVDADSARAAFAEALGLFGEVGDGSAIALLLEDFAEVATADGDALRASRLRGAAAGARRTTQAELTVANALWQLGDAVPRGLIDPAALERAWAEGHAMTQPAAIAYALRSEVDPVIEEGLRVSALGPLIVERWGLAVSDWGGPKAGSRHALAIFAFLMDRGDRGVTKDEFIEVLWPDAEVRQGDLNFHRTLGGLRSTLASGPAGEAAGEPQTVKFSNGRYRLAPAIVGWLDVAEFQQRLLSAVEATDAMSAIRGLESARVLYRGDYLDDCPLYGDSPFVEERRRFLRGRLVDALVDLGRRYEARREDNLASARFREALTVSDGDCPSAVEGLERLGMGTA